MEDVGGSYGFISSLVLWLIVPRFIAKFVLSQYYLYLYGKNNPNRPKENSNLYQKHFQVAYSIVICGYFLYSITDYIYNLESSFYTIFGVPRTQVDAQLKSHFRQTVLALHPDKNPTGNSDNFLKLKSIYEILSNELTRAAYDCFGPEVIKTVTASSSKSSLKPTLSEYLVSALMSSGAFHAASSLFFIIIAGIGKKSVIYWRMLGLLCVLGVELYVLMRPLSFGHHTPSEWEGVFLIGNLLKAWFNVPTYQKIKCMRQFNMLLSMAMGQISSVSPSSNNETNNIKDMATRCEELSKGMLIKETEHQLASVMDPIGGNHELESLLQNRMGKLAAELQLFEMLDANERKKLKKN